MSQVQHSTDFWSRLQGVKLGGRRMLGEWMGDDGTHRYYLTDPVADEKRVVVAVVKGDSPALEKQLDCWNAVARLRHPHLVRVFETGSDEYEGRPVAYAVMEHPEEDLGSVILGRPLSGDETTDVARALVAALAYLHDEGLVHGDVDPWKIVAVGDTTKLITHKASPAGPSSIASDVRALGFTLCQLLTGKNDGALMSSRALPAPFDEIVRGSTQRGWSLRQIGRALDGLPPEVDPPVVAPLVVQQPAVEDPPAAVEVPEAVPAFRFMDRMKWVYLAAAVGLAAAVMFIAASRPAPPPKPNPPATRVAAVLPAMSTAVSAEARLPAERAAWRVIAYTFSRQKDAEERAKRLMVKWPHLRPEVYSPNGAAGPHLVTIGGPLTRVEALRLQAKARRGGLPRDTFTRNFAK